MVVVAGVGRLDGGGGLGVYYRGGVCLICVKLWLSPPASGRRERREGGLGKGTWNLGDPCWEAQKEDRVEGGLLRM